VLDLIDLRLERETPHGRLAAIAIDPALFERLPPEEQAIAAGFGPKRRATFAAGRAVLHHLLARHGVEESFAILRDDRGAPVLPAGFTGSISHKDSIACALVSAGDARIGVDVERADAVRVDLAEKILTDPERARFTTPFELTLVFSLKEALYKALDPFVRRYVGFKEVAVRSLESGVFEVFGPYTAEGTWLCEQGHVITSARVRRA
jgi:4'-phosphopantetheinyl transferase EntD